MSEVYYAMATSGFRLGIYVCKDAEIVDFAAPHGVFAVARRFDPELEAFARVMEYSQAYRAYRDDIEVLQPAVTG